MSAREKDILADIVSRTDFNPQKVIWRSPYWKMERIGAVHYLGTYKNKPAVLKIQGVKPDVSEIYMIKQFTTQNRSKIIKPTKLFTTLPWSESKQYEALIMEHVTGKKVLQNGKLQTRKNISKFFGYYQEYRKNCLPKKPWLPKPAKVDLDEDLQNLISISKKVYPDNPFRKAEDKKIAAEAVGVLKETYKNIPLEFVHAHFSVEDLVYQDKKVVLFSNLFWKWKYPFCDAIFGYHWFIYTLERVKGIRPTQVEKQREIWLSELFNLPRVRKSSKNLRLAKAALLERAVTGMIIDNFLVDPKRPIAEYLTQSTREQVRKLTGELS